MKIDGKALANEIYRHLKSPISALKQKGTIPHIVVVSVGSDNQTSAYIHQKQKAAKLLGINVSIVHFPKAPIYQKIAERVLKLDQDPSVDGIVIQRPLPPSLSAFGLTKRVHTNKDIDAFLPKTPYIPPVAGSIFHILNEIYFRQLTNQKRPSDIFSKELIHWLKNLKIVLLGRGETGGAPIAETLQKYHINFLILNSKSTNREEYLKQADCIISAVGKPNIFSYSDLKTNAIIIGVGIHRKNGKLFGDYNEEDIKKVARFYTSTPGGTGPLTVACLMQNAVEACIRNHS